MRSAGCIMLELFLKVAPFQAPTEIEQLGAIFDVCGEYNMKDHEFIDRMKNIDTLFKWIHFTTLSGKKKPRLKEKFGDRVPEAALDLVAKLLDLNPAARPSAQDAREHKWFHTKPLPCVPHECVFGY